MGALLALSEALHEHPGGQPQAGLQLSQRILRSVQSTLRIYELTQTITHTLK